MVAAPVERKGRAVLRLFSRKEKNSVADGYQRQLHSVILGPPLEVQESHDDGPTRFLLSSKCGELRRHCSNACSGFGDRHISTNDVARAYRCRGGRRTVGFGRSAGNGLLAAAVRLGRLDEAL